MRWLVIVFGPVLTPLLCRTQAVWWMSRFECSVILLQTLYFIVILGDRVLCWMHLVLLLLFFLWFCIESVAFGAIFVVEFVFFSRSVSFFVFNVADCWLHLNIVAHNLHVVYCQFYACSRCCGVLSHVIYVFCTFVLVSLFFPLAGDVLESSRSLHQCDAIFFIFVNTFCVTIFTTKREFQLGKTMKKQWDQNAQQPLYRSDLDCELSATTSSIYCTDSRSHLVTLHKST